jgi:hypothetical protein
LIVVLNNLSWPFLLIPVAVGACALALFASAWHRVALLDRASVLKLRP